MVTQLRGERQTSRLTPRYARAPVGRAVYSPVLYIFCIMISLGATEYLFVYLAAPDKAVYFSLDKSLRSDPGIYTYGKDLAIILFGLYWPFWVVYCGSASLVRTFFINYTLWFSLVLGFGLLPFAFDPSHVPYAAGGVRWLALLHASFGVAVMALAAPVPRRSLHVALIVLTILCFIDVTQALKQLSIVGISPFGDLGGARLPGMFASAGTAGYFSVGVGLFAATAKRASGLLRVALLFFGFIVGYLSGTRVAVVCYGLFFLALSSETRDMRIRLAAAATATPVAVAMVVILTLSAGRGNPLDQSNGGRFDKWSDFLDLLSNQASLPEILFGKGLGVATNASFGIAEKKLMPISDDRWMFISDDTFINIFIQFGILGSIVFWYGLFLFCAKGLGRAALTTQICIVLCLFIQNMTEQPFLMLPFAFVLSAGYRDDRT